MIVDVYLCGSCEERFPEPARPVYECSGCGTTQVDDKRCQQCNRFTAKVGDESGPECEGCDDITQVRPGKAPTATSTRLRERSRRGSPKLLTLSARRPSPEIAPTASLRRSTPGSGQLMKPSFLNSSPCFLCRNHFTYNAEKVSLPRHRRRARARVPPLRTQGERRARTPRPHRPSHHPPRLLRDGAAMTEPAVQPCGCTPPPMRDR